MLIQIGRYPSANRIVGTGDLLREILNESRRDEAIEILIHENRLLRSTRNQPMECRLAQSWCSFVFSANGEILADFTVLSFARFYLARMGRARQVAAGQELTTTKGEDAQWPQLAP